MSDPKQARALIEAAARDLTTVRLMANNADFPDENFGFNVQQGAEKLCKAWLSLLGEIYPLTHDLGYLLDRLIGLNAEAARNTEVWLHTLRLPWNFATRARKLRLQPSIVRKRCDSWKS